MTGYITKRGISEHFAVSTRTVDNWRDRGILPPPIKLGPAAQGRVRWPADVLASVAVALGRDQLPAA